MQLENIPAKDADLIVPVHTVDGTDFQSKEFIEIDGRRLYVDDLLTQTSHIYWPQWRTQFEGDLYDALEIGIQASGAKITNPATLKERYMKPKDCIRDIGDEFASRIEAFPEGQKFSLIPNTDEIRAALLEIFEKQERGSEEIDKLWSSDILVAGAISMFRTTLETILREETWADATDNGTFTRAHIPEGNIGVCPAVSAPDWIRGLVRGIGGRLVMQEYTLAQQLELDAVTPLSRFARYDLFLNQISKEDYSIISDSNGNFYIVEGQQVDVSEALDLLGGDHITYHKGDEAKRLTIPRNYVFLRSYKAMQRKKGLKRFDPNMQLHVGKGAQLLQIKPHARHDPASNDYCILLAYVLNPASNIAEETNKITQDVVLK
jgi:hypothetical protein